MLSHNYTQFGASAIASGGYGCVFNPALLCKGEKIRTHGISKLLIKKHADQELNEIKKFVPLIEQIPNHNKYFIISNISSCIPDKLDQNDFIDFNPTCNKIISRVNVTEHTINNNLDKFKILNIPNGGSHIFNYFKTFNKETFDIFNNSLLILLTGGILPMNAKNIYHFDLKMDNMVIDNLNTIRIIDWGLAGIQNKKNIPEQALNRPIQFNCPITNILLNKDVRHLIKKALLDIKLPALASNTYLKYEYILPLLNKLMPEIYNLQYEGHLSYMKHFYVKYYKAKGVHQINTDDHLFKSIIIRYLAKAIITYTNKNTYEFSSEKYFNDVYKKNVDIFGFMTCYNDLYSYIIDNTKWTDTLLSKKILLHKLHQLCNKYIYYNTYSDKAINYSELILDIQSLSFNKKKPNLLARHNPNSNKISNKKINKISIKMSNKMSNKKCKKGYRINKKHLNAKKYYIDNIYII